MSSRVTMSDVARQAGVSLMIVSRVINNKGDVSSETRQRVLEILVVLINRRLQAAQDSLDRLNLDNRCGRIAAEHLVRSGHKRIRMVSGPPASYRGVGRRRGFLAALRDAGIKLLEGWIRPCQPLVEGGHEATRRLLGMYPRLTALFCFNDLDAVGASQLLASKIDDLPRGQLKLLGIDSREDPSKHSVRRKAIRQLQKGLQPRQITLPKQFNIYSADHRTNGNRHDLN